MKNIVFDDGYKEFMINDDNDRVIRFNPADISILERFKVAQDKINEVYNNIDDMQIKADGTAMDGVDETVQVISHVNKVIKEQVDFIFDNKVSNAVFGNQSPLSMVKGIPLFERFIVAAQKHIEKELIAEQKASQKRIEKYTKVYHK